MHFRHVPRERNSIADWLTNVARKKGADVDCTATCVILKPFDNPPGTVVQADVPNLVAPVTTRATNKRLRLEDSSPTVDTSRPPAIPPQTHVQLPYETQPQEVTPTTGTERSP